MPKKLVVASNLLNEADQLDEWFSFVLKIADGGILIVDGGSTDNSMDIYNKYKKEQFGLISDNIIQREGYGPARNHLRQAARELFPDAHWMLYLDADERILPADFHTLRFIKDNLSMNYDVVGLPRIDWKDQEMTEAAKDVHVNPDWQARMSRLYGTSLRYIRRLHEQVVDYSGIYCDITNPKINHHHRSTGQEKRDFIGKICAKLHMEDEEYGSTYPEHHKEAMYRERYLKEGL
jgi:glycosyltransferase involved in cell wall biosynthesis